jgi:hypothetical protein
MTVSLKQYNTRKAFYLKNPTFICDQSLGCPGDKAVTIVKISSSNTAIESDISGYIGHPLDSGGN